MSEFRTWQVESTDASEFRTWLLLNAVSCHDANCNKCQVRAAAAATRAAETKAREDAKSAAIKLVADKKKIRNIFLLDISQIKSAAFCNEVKAFEPEMQVDLNVPLVWKTHEAVTKFANEPEVQVFLGNFAGRYKKTPEMKADQRVQNPVTDTAVKKHSDNMMSQLKRCLPADSLVDVTTLPKTFPNVSKMTWIYGCDSAMKIVAPTPNGLAGIKWLGMGEIRWLIFSLGNLLPAMKIKFAKNTFTMEEIRECVEDFDLSTLQELHRSSSDFKLHVLDQQPNTVVYVPAGSIVAEMATKGALVYGIRQAIMTASGPSNAAYGTLIEVKEAGKENVAKMREALTIMSDATKN